MPVTGKQHWRLAAGRPANETGNRLSKLLLLRNSGSLQLNRKWGLLDAEQEATGGLARCRGKQLNDDVEGLAVGQQALPNRGLAVGLQALPTPKSVEVIMILCYAPLMSDPDAQCIVYFEPRGLFKEKISHI